MGRGPALEQRPGGPDRRLLPGFRAGVYRGPPSPASGRHPPLGGLGRARAGLPGVSYLASAQWSIAATNPPHLAAINPWEGWSDTYREVVRHGGIPETYFWPYIGQRWGYGTNL